jgi:quinohemoprotein ethanol dehydrogenase
MDIRGYLDPIRRAAVVLLLCAGCAPADPLEEALRATAAIDGRAIEDPRRAADWLSHGRTYAEQRFSPLAQIDRDNVAQLGLAWYLDLPAKGTVEATPLVADGVIYTTGSWGVVHAVDARTGRMIWTHDPQAQTRAAEAVVWDRNRGVALYQGKVYVAVADGRLIALDARDGKVAWTAQTFDRAVPYGSTGAPRVFDGKVIIGQSGGDIGTRGYASAYDSRTGELLWRFHAVPGDPAKGFEDEAMRMAARTWKGEWWKYGGGGNPWNAFAYDPELRLVYLGFGNGGPWNQGVRSPGGGDNLFLASIVAVNVDTGKYVWHYQNTPGESWDFPAAMDMVLADLLIDGETRKVLMQAPKNGFYYVLDRATGKVISAEKFVKVTWAERVDLATGRPVETPGIRLDGGPVDIWPSPAGGHNWYPMSFSPQSGLAYFAYREAGLRYEALDLATYEFRAGVFDTSVRRGPVGGASEGGLMAWNPVSQREAWRLPLPTMFVGGTAATAGGLVFAGTGDGRLLAVDDRDGKLLWEAPTHNAVMGGPAVFSVDGEQFVAVMAGIGGGMSQEHGLVPMGYRYGVDRRLLVFKLGGTATLPAKPEPPPLLAVPPPGADPRVQRGAGLYVAHCGSCHGPAAINAGGAPDLRRSAFLDTLEPVLFEGTLTSAGMPVFGKYLRRDEADDLKAYLLHRAGLSRQPSR